MPRIPLNLLDAVARQHDQPSDDRFYPVVSGALAGLFISALDAAEHARRAIINGEKDLALLHINSILASDPRKETK
jgi:hypothetical protein